MFERVVDEAALLRTGEGLLLFVGLKDGTAPVETDIDDGDSEGAGGNTLVDGANATAETLPVDEGV